MLTKCLLDLVRPFLRHFPRGTGTLYRILGGYRHCSGWNNLDVHVTRGGEHGYRIALDLGDYFERETYYLGRFYEWEIQAVVKSLLRPGDAFIDVGANIGMLTLYGAAVVGSMGTVLAFEPNPEARARLHRHLEMNGLSHVRVYDRALSDARGRSVLAMPSHRTGTGTLRSVDGHSCRSFDIQTARLDDFIAEIPRHRRVLLKIDTEGYDFNVLKGASRLLSRSRVSVIAEVNEKWLGELGQCAGEMFAYMTRFGYRSYLPRIQSGALRRKLVIEPLSLPGPGSGFNVLFLRDADLKAVSVSCR